MVHLPEIGDEAAAEAKLEVGEFRLSGLISAAILETVSVLDKRCAVLVLLKEHFFEENA